MEGNTYTKSPAFSFCEDCNEKETVENEYKRLEDLYRWECSVTESLSELYRPLISKDASFQEMADNILKLAKSLTGSFYGYVSIIDPLTKGNIICSYDESLNVYMTGQERIILPLGKDGKYPSLCGYTLNTLKPFYTNSPEEHPESVGIPEWHFPVKSFLSVPVMVAGKAEGQISVANPGRNYTDNDERAISRMAEFYALAIQRKRVDDELKLHRENLEDIVRKRTFELIEANKKLLEEISERKKVEDELLGFSTVIEQAGEHVVITDKNARILYVNPSFEKGTGYTGEELIGKTPQLLKSGKHDEKFFKDLWETITAGKVWTGHFINKKKDGSLYECDATISPIKDSNGNITNYVSVRRDVTEKLKLEKNIRQSQKMESLGTLAGGVAHDFNNILASIMGFTELALEEVSKDSISHNFLTRSLKSCHRAKDLVKQILSFCRKSEQERKAVKLSFVISETMNLLRPTLPATIDMETDINIKNDIIMADHMQLHQVIMNLCTNSAHAMEEKGGKLKIGLTEITLEEEDELLCRNLKRGRYAKLSVNDTGHGMDRNILERIFEPYFTTKNQEDGTGLGLSVVHGIVNTHGGDIRVYSEPGKGTEFNICFPLIESELEEEIENLNSFQGGNEKILLVDDEEDLLNMAEKILKRLGYKVTATINSREALNIFQKNPLDFDLIITDQTMPYMTGYDLARKVLAIRPDIPVILCTGFSRNINEEKAREGGIKDYLVKPFTKKSLAEAIRKAVNIISG